MNLDETFPALSENRQPPEPAFNPLCFVFVSDIARLCNKLSTGTSVSLALFLSRYLERHLFQKLRALHVSQKATCLTQVISNQISTGCGHFSIFDE